MRDHICWLVEQVQGNWASEKRLRNGMKDQRQQLIIDFMMNESLPLENLTVNYSPVLVFRRGPVLSGQQHYGEQDGRRRAGWRRSRPMASAQSSAWRTAADPEFEFISVRVDFEWRMMNQFSLFSSSGLCSWFAHNVGTDDHQNWRIK